MHYAGRQVTHQFRDVKQAVAYALSCQRGPQARRPNWGEPRVHGDRDAGSMVLAAIRGDLGITPGGDRWRAMEDWAFCGGPRPAWVTKQLRPLLGQAGLLNDQQEPDTVKIYVEDVVFVDEETGEEMKTFREEVD